jgi:intracellular septation protein A
MSTLLAAIRPLAFDFLPTIVFAILTALHVDVAMATASALGVGALQLIVVRATGRPIALLQWAGLGLAAVFGAAAILAHDPRFVMAKPTLIYVAIGVVMLKRGWMIRYMPAAGKGHEDLMIFWGYVWAGLMFATAAANALIAAEYSRAWPAFIAIFPLPSKLILFGIQYLSIRQTIIRRETAAARLALAA